MEIRPWGIGKSKYAPKDETFSKPYYELIMLARSLKYSWRSKSWIYPLTFSPEALQNKSRQWIITFNWSKEHSQKRTKLSAKNKWDRGRAEQLIFMGFQWSVWVLSLMIAHFSILIYNELIAGSWNKHIWYRTACHTLPYILIT